MSACAIVSFCMQCMRTYLMVNAVRALLAILSALSSLTHTHCCIVHPHTYVRMYHCVHSFPVAPRQNKPPEIRFSTSPNVTIRLPENTYLLDASQSTDDDKDDPLHFQWELISKPVGAPPVKPSSTAVQNLEKLRQGVYVFKLVVDAVSLPTGLL